MATASRIKPFTFEDFCVLVHEDRKGDLIDGVIYLTAPESTDENELWIRFASILGTYVETKDLGQIYGSRVALRFDDRNVSEPDILFIRKERFHLVQKTFIDGPADLVVEIVSPESKQRDYKMKRAQYERAGIAEYWLIDEIDQKVLLLRLTSKGTYAKVRPVKGALHSRVLPGFWFRPEWLWQDTCPTTPEILDQILGRES
jgi:Uma2 family endonuclease